MSISQGQLIYPWHRPSKTIPPEILEEVRCTCPPGCYKQSRLRGAQRSVSARDQMDSKTTITVSAVLVGCAQHSLPVGTLVSRFPPQGSGCGGQDRGARYGPSVVPAKTQFGFMRPLLQIFIGQFALRGPLVRGGGTATTLPRSLVDSGIEFAVSRGG